MQNKQFLKDGDSKINSKLERPPVPKIDPSEEDFLFFCIDIDNYTDKPPKYISDKLNVAKDQTILRLFGVTEKGNSLTVHVFNFKPYFYI